MEIWQIKISGLVQGVCFRYFVDTFVKTRVPRIKGFVQNMPDGSVEVWVQGITEDLQVLKEACAKGPPAARVEQVEVTKLMSSNEILKRLGEGFRISHPF